MRVLLFRASAGSLVRAADDASDDDNVNSKYTIEALEVIPTSVGKRLSGSLKSDMDALVGTKFDPAAVDKISSRLGKEVHRKVERRLERGAQT